MLVPSTVRDKLLLAQATLWKDVSICEQSDDLTAPPGDVCISLSEYEQGVTIIFPPSGKSAIGANR